jgi:membrane fusion protein
MFRAEATSRNRDRLSGDVALAIPVQWQAIAYLLFGSLAAATLFLSLASYSRVETVTGSLMPDAGISPVVATRTGIIAKIAAKDGEIVTAGTPLATIRSEEDGTASQAPGALVEAAIARQDASLSMQFSASLAAAEAQIAQLAAQQAGLTAEIDQLRLQKDAQARLIISAEEDLNRATEIAPRGFISKRDMQVREETLLSRQQGMAQLDQAIAAKRAALAENIRSSAVITAQARSQSASVEANRAQVAQQAASASASRAYVLRAPVAGRVTALTARVGQPVSSGMQLMAIVPEGSRLTAELAVPSAAIGFVKPGQDVRLALDAFPYQRFGTVKGRIRTVPSSTVNTQAPNGATIPVYPVIVDIESPQVSAYGRDEPLVAGMSLTARIITEKQSLMEWLFEPLFAVLRR